MFHPEQKQSEGHCETTNLQQFLFIYLFIFWFNAFHFSGYLLRQVLKANLVMHARPAANVAKKFQILAALMAPTPPDRD